MEKPGSNGKVTAKNVFEIFPKFEGIPLKTVQVSNDDAHYMLENMGQKDEEEC
jgi:hypothetical protein